MVAVGAGSSSEDLYGDWVMVHEWLHLGQPFTREAWWLMEGIAAYIEPLVRARKCWRSPRSVWREFHRDMSRGIPALRGGLMNNGCNAYWSYALFLFLADRNIRKYTRGRRGIEGCLRAVLRGGGDATQCWRAQQVVDICDGLLGKPVLSDLLKKYGQRGGTVDFSKIWHELGAEASGHDARLRNNRPDARVRDAIITGGIGRDLPIGPDTYR